MSTEKMSAAERLRARLVSLGLARVITPEEAAKAAAKLAVFEAVKIAKAEKKAKQAQKRVGKASKAENKAARLLAYSLLSADEKSELLERSLADQAATQARRAEKELRTKAAEAQHALDRAAKADRLLAYSLLSDDEKEARSRSAKAIRILKRSTGACMPRMCLIGRSESIRIGLAPFSGQFAINSGGEFWKAGVEAFVDNHMGEPDLMGTLSFTGKHTVPVLANVCVVEGVSHVDVYGIYEGRLSKLATGRPSGTSEDIEFSFTYFSRVMTAQPCMSNGRHVMPDGLHERLFSGRPDESSGDVQAPQM
jgi:hypothetical protein